LPHQGTIVHAVVCAALVASIFCLVDQLLTHKIDKYTRLSLAS